MQDKDVYANAIETELDYLESTVDSLLTDRKVDHSTRQECEDLSFAALDARTRLETLREADADHWRRLKVGVEGATAVLRSSVDRVAANVVARDRPV